eukprot:CCRYP_008136-RA/>CCRYP_008136-RA protein AED:0.49 eAED:1.00 QI:0/-1/0/1/-1/0/1/0/26
MVKMLMGSIPISLYLGKGSQKQDRLP